MFLASEALSEGEDPAGVRGAGVVFPGKGKSTVWLMAQ